MKNHTTFKIGGNAKTVITPTSVNELVEVIKCLKNERFLVIGNGSNILAPDEGIDYFVIKTSKINSVNCDKNKICAECGATLAKIASVALENSLAGFEFASGIPGTIGGGIVMNAGAYDGELSQVVKTTLFCDRMGNVYEISGNEHKFGYRHSFFSDKDYVVLSSVIELESGIKDDISLKMKELNKRRSDKQPLNYPSAGSTFKRPEGYFAAKLIDDCGLKGASVGGAKVSEKHSGFIINSGNATANDVKQLISLCQKEVFEKFAVNIEPEIKIL
ncbi:MAG: UDP-N-acetylmuramate dehydrogenase [Clostridia bacterium]|nr:UDP-N-acetylmuramate dehydrogenase [Clostridia bacterium]